MADVYQSGHTIEVGNITGNWEWKEEFGDDHPGAKFLQVKLLGGGPGDFVTVLDTYKVADGQPSPRMTLLVTMDGESRKDDFPGKMAKPKIDLDRSSLSAGASVVFIIG